MRVQMRWMPICGLMLLALSLVCVGCANEGSRLSEAGEAGNAGAGGAVLAPVARIDAIPSSLIVVPIDPAWVFDPAASATGLLDDGRKLSVRFYGVKIEAVPVVDGVGARRQEWVPSTAIWSAVALEAGRGGAQGAGLTPVMAIEIPATAGGKFLDVGGKRWTVNWLASPRDAMGAAGRTKEGAAESGAIWRPTLPAAGAVSAVFAAYSRPESQSPIGRWRYRMLTDGLAPPGTSDAAAGSMLPAFEDPIIEAIAKQNEGRWQTALAMLWGVDPDLAWRIKLRLTGVMDFGEGVVAPAWPTDHAILDLLLGDLLDPALSPAQRARRGAEWLEAQPAALAWVMDDAGVLDARKGLGVATVGVANLSERATLAWAEAEGERREPDLHPAPAGSMVKLAVAPIEESRPGQAPTLLSAHLGKWSKELRVVTRPIGLKPPGLTVGPLLPDLTLGSWQEESRARAMASGWVTVGRLHSPATAGGGKQTYELYVECRSSGEGAGREEDVVRVWLGPTGVPLAVLRVSEAGTVMDELVPGREAQAIAVVRTAGGWSFHLPIPAAAVERDGILRMAMTRTDGRGRRSSWPRAMLPWQREPGRIAVDTTAWSEEGR